MITASTAGAAYAEDKQQAALVLTAKERQELEAFAAKPRLIKRLNELLGHAGIVGEERNRIFLLIIAISHKTRRNVARINTRPSGSGKNAVTKTDQRLYALPESVTRLTRLSDKVLYNFPEHYFVNRLLCTGGYRRLIRRSRVRVQRTTKQWQTGTAPPASNSENGQITSGQKTVKALLHHWPAPPMARYTRTI